MRIPTDEEVIKAIDDSIKHWEEIVSVLERNVGAEPKYYDDDYDDRYKYRTWKIGKDDICIYSDACALCNLYSDLCIYCPMATSGNAKCNRSSSVWMALHDHIRMHIVNTDTINSAQKMLDILIDLKNKKEK